MKKIILLLILLLIFLPNFECVTNANITYYAKIKNENVCMYSSPIGESDYQLFVLPNSYFVELLDDENDDFYKAKFKDQIGYVKKNQVSVMSGVPIKPYPNQTFRIFCLEGLSIYSTPFTSSSSKISTIPYLTDDVVFYGELAGEQAIPDKTRTWYYCNYHGEENCYGYVYSVFCDKLTPLDNNNETFDIIENPVFSIQAPEESMSQTTMVFIILGVSLPCLIVIYLLIKPTIMKEKIIEGRPAKKKHHGDYFEFDESDLN